jgi:hypothetical protein
MPSAIVTLPDGRRARLQGPTRDAIMQQASQLGGLGRDPNTGETDPTLLDVDMHMRGLSPRGSSESRAPLTLPMGMGQFSVGGVTADAVRALSSVRDETSVPFALGTMASIAFPPAAAVRGAPLVKGLIQRFGPTVLAAGVGGGAGSALVESGEKDATAGSIARAGLRGGAQMAAAEVAGLGIGGLANKAIAPNVRFLDPMKPIRERAAEVARSMPEHMRSGLSRFTEALPEGGVKNAAEGVRAAATQVNDLFRRLVSEKAAQSTVSTRVVAERVARALNETVGRNHVRYFDRAVRNNRTIELLRQRLTKSQFDDVLTVTLARVLDRATVTQGGRRVLDGSQFLTRWRQLPNAVRESYSSATRRAVESLGVLGNTLSQAGRFAASPIGGEVLEAAVVPAVTAVFGLSVGIPLYIAKALISPSPLVRYLTLNKLPSEFTRTVGRQAATAPIRGGLLEEDQ